MPDDGPQSTGNARWILGRVLHVDNMVEITLGGYAHMITRDQAIALGGRLLEVGIGTTYADERAINAQIGDLICEAKRRG